MTLGRKNNGFERKNSQSSLIRLAVTAKHLFPFGKSVFNLLGEQADGIFFLRKQKGLGNCFQRQMLPAALHCLSLRAHDWNPMFKIIPLLSQNLTLSGIKNKLYFQITEKALCSFCFRPSSQHTGPLLWSFPH